jgi:hypothetical protein
VKIDDAYQNSLHGLLLNPELAYWHQPFNLYFPYLVSKLKVK